MTEKQPKKTDAGKRPSLTGHKFSPADQDRIDESFKRNEEAYRRLAKM